MKRKKKINRDIDAVIVATYRKTKKSKNPDHWYYVNLYVFSLLVYFEKNERKVVFLFIDQNYNRTEILLDTEEDCIEMFEVVKKTLKKNKEDDSIDFLLEPLKEAFNMKKETYLKKIKRWTYYRIAKLKSFNVEEAIYGYDYDPFR